MKFIIFAGTPGSGKTSIIKSIIQELKNDFKLFFAKFDCLQTLDDEKIAKEYKIPAVKKLAGELCPDHYTALEIPKIIKENKDKDIIILETAGLCLRCSPYVEEGLGINVLDITSGDPSRYGPILTEADVVAISKGDLISQAEREIFRAKVLKVNPKAKITEVNGLTGEGAFDIAEFIKESLAVKSEKLTLKHSMPSAICGYCYGNRIIDETESRKRFLAGKELKSLVPNLNCGKCGYKSCNEFIRAVLDGKAQKEKCPFIKKEI
ncbi:AAA family ATPase [Candidatus Wolfebacteria bacterium]|nr:AAA family ATPase [Candidatus Wolfebacteria bacterium]